MRARSLLFAVLALAACSTPAPATLDTGVDAASADAARDAALPEDDAWTTPLDDAGVDAPATLRAIASDVVGYVGEEVALDASASTGAGGSSAPPGR